MSDEGRTPQDRTRGAGAAGSGDPGSWAAPVAHDRDEEAARTVTADEVPLAPSGGDTVVGLPLPPAPPAHDRTVVDTPGGPAGTSGTPGPGTAPGAGASGSGNPPGASGAPGSPAASVTSGAQGTGPGARPSAPTPTVADHPAPAAPTSPGGSPGASHGSGGTPWPAPAAGGAPSAGGTTGGHPAQAPGPGAPSIGKDTDPFAPPAPAPSGHLRGGHVPPPPLSPEGPGRMPYGHPHPPAVPGGSYAWAGTAPLPSNGAGTAGLVLGVLAALLFCFWPLALILGVLGVIFGAIGHGKAARGEATNGGQALAGIICGAVGVLLAAGVTVLFFLPY